MGIFFPAVPKIELERAKSMHEKRLVTFSKQRTDLNVFIGLFTVFK